mmetsp:Transcript_2725/g.7998  ORF Transcript_2725/g.7998 Transcript_2725/m.7998 type:complete len:269 (+) Transcript_2725:703-1509(+)
MLPSTSLSFAAWLSALSGGGRRVPRWIRFGSAWAGCTPCPRQASSSCAYPRASPWARWPCRRARATASCSSACCRGSSRASPSHVPSGFTCTRGSRRRARPSTRQRRWPRSSGAGPWTRCSPPRPPSSVACPPRPSPTRTSRSTSLTRLCMRSQAAPSSGASTSSSPTRGTTRPRTSTAGFRSGAPPSCASTAVSPSCGLTSAVSTKRTSPSTCRVCPSSSPAASPFSCSADPPTSRASGASSSSSSSWKWAAAWTRWRSYSPMTWTI